MDCMNDRSKPAYCAAAEVVGMVLRHLADDVTDVMTSLCDYVHTLLASRASGNTDAFLHCLHKLQIHYAPIVDKYVSTVLEKLLLIRANFFLILLLNQTQVID